MNSCILFTSSTHFDHTRCLSLEKKNVIFHLFFKSKKMVFIDLWNTVPHVFLRLFNTNQKSKLVTKNKMDNLGFEEDIQMTHQDDDFDDYRKPDTSRLDETFTVPDTTEVTSTLRLRQKLKQNKIVSLYRYLDVTGDPGLTNLDRFMIFFSMVLNIGNPLLINGLVSF